MDIDAAIIDYVTRQGGIASCGVKQYIQALGYKNPVHVIPRIKALAERGDIRLTEAGYCLHKIK